MGIESIKLDHLRYFVTATETGSFAAAGEKLNITPTSIAHGVKALEEALETVLLIRRRAAGVIPNQEGKQLLVNCRRIFTDIEDMTDKFTTKDGQLKGDLIVGCQEGLSWSIIPRVVAELSKLHPKLNIAAKTVFMDQELQPLEDSEIDLLITFKVGHVQSNFSDKLDRGMFYSKVMCSPQAYALVHGSHPVCEEGKTEASLAELADYPHIFIKDGPAYALFSTMYEDIGLTPKVAAVSNISSAAQSFVGQTEAVSLRIVRPSIPLSPLGDELAFLKLRDEVRKPDVIAITHLNSQGGISRKAEAFIDACQQKFDDGTLKVNFFY